MKNFFLLAVLLFVPSAVHAATRLTTFYAFLGKVVDQIINPIILLLASAAFILFLWGVFEFIRDAEDEGKREEGRRAMLWGLIGLVIIFGAYGIINLALATFDIDPIDPNTLERGVDETQFN
ncbi:MAG TPA: hypothetical protein VM103_01720 [Candidatus Paceibacterota bacterium]|nr:hypothetical protein [Candidatus Paceibacterota bacterium]